MGAERQPDAASYTGDTLARGMGYSAAWLERHAAEIDALNVFPVPDGDTGLNMSVTLRAAVAEIDQREGTLPAVADAAARGALMGARGNSGVILSQMLRGVADALVGLDELTSAKLATALTCASRTAYRAVLHPVEGTMLTVAREAAEAACRAADRSATVEETLAAAAQAADEAVLRTPEQLDVLREAGVVDAGGRGLAVFLTGLLRALRGAPIDEALTGAAARDRPLHLGGEEDYGYCTEFVVLASGLDLAGIRASMAQLGRSVLVVGDDTAVRVHLHTLDPGAALSQAVRQGTLTRIKIDNMTEQHAAFRQQALRSRVVPPAQAEGALPVVAVVSGDGFAALYASLGALCVATDERGTNPSVAELIAGIEAVEGSEVLVLPNDPNVAPAAEQAARQVAKTVTILPSCDMAQGLAALMAYSLPLSPAQNRAAMEDAIRRVRSARVTWAARNAAIGGVYLPAGSAMALADKRLIAHGPDVATVVLEALAALGGDNAQLVTLYAGQGRAGSAAGRDGARAADELAARVRARWPHAEVEIVHGQQPNDDYLLAVE